jgi:hypothetical protein
MGIDEFLEAMDDDGMVNISLLKGSEIMVQKITAPDIHPDSEKVSFDNEEYMKFFIYAGLHGFPINENSCVTLKRQDNNEFIMKVDSWYNPMVEMRFLIINGKLKTKG